MLESTAPLVIISRSELESLLYDVAHRAATDAVKLSVAKGQSGEDLWDSARVAEYLGVSAYTVAHDWAHKPGFPAAITLGGGPKAKRRWKEKEIRRWASTRG